METQRIGESWRLHGRMVMPVFGYLEAGNHLRHNFLFG